MERSDSNLSFLPIKTTASEATSPAVTEKDALAILNLLQDGKAVDRKDEVTKAFRVAAQRFFNFVSDNSNHGLARQNWNLAHNAQIAQVASHGESLALYLQVSDEYNLDELYFKQPRLGLTREEVRIACNRLIFCPYKYDFTDYYSAEKREAARDDQLARIRRERKPPEPLNKSDMAALLKAAGAGGKRGGRNHGGAGNKNAGSGGDGSGSSNSSRNSGNSGNSNNSGGSGGSTSRRNTRSSARAETKSEE